MNNYYLVKTKYRMSGEDKQKAYQLLVQAKDPSDAQEKILKWIQEEGRLGTRKYKDYLTGEMNEEPEEVQVQSIKLLERTGLHIEKEGYKYFYQATIEFKDSKNKPANLIIKHDSIKLALEKAELELTKLSEESGAIVTKVILTPIFDYCG